MKISQEYNLRPIMCKALGVNTADFAQTSLNFADADEIQPWAV